MLRAITGEKLRKKEKCRCRAVERSELRDTGSLVGNKSQYSWMPKQKSIRVSSGEGREK